MLELSKISASRVRKLRRDSGMTQAELAAKLGVSRDCVSNWERNAREINPPELCKMACLFNVSADYLLGKVETHSIIKIPGDIVIDFNLFNHSGKQAMYTYYKFLLTQDIYLKDPGQDEGI